MERDPRVVVCIWDKDDPYHYIEVRGDVTDIVRGEPARQHIDELAMRYFGRLYDGDAITSERVIVRISPDGGRGSTAAARTSQCASESDCGACSRRGRRRAATSAPTVSTSRTPASPTSWATTRCGCRSTTSTTTATAPPCCTAAAAGLAVTQRLRLATGMLLAPYQRPARVAAAAREIGRRFGGRLDVGVGMGYRDVEFDGKGVPRRERVRRLTELVGELEPGAGDETYTVLIGAQAERGVARAGRLGHGILLSGALPLDDRPCPRRGTQRRHGSRVGGGAEPSPASPPCATCGSRPTPPNELPCSIGSGRAMCSTRDSAGRWPSPTLVAAMDFAGDAAAAIETAVATTIIGSVDEVIDGLHEVAAAGVDDVVLRIAVEGAPQAAIHTVMRTFAEGVFPVLADDGAVPCASV